MSTLITAGLNLINELKDGHEAHKERLLARYDEAIKLPRKKKKAVVVIPLLCSVLPVVPLPLLATMVAALVVVRN